MLKPISSVKHAVDLKEQFKIQINPEMDGGIIWMYAHNILENQEDNAFWTKEQGSYSWRNKNPLLSRICRTVTMRFFADKWKFNELIYEFTV